MCDLHAMFFNMKSQYPAGVSMFCTFSLGSARPLDEDRLQLYRVGWTDILKCITSEPIPKPSELHNMYTIKFEGVYLPSPSADQYEVCYISNGSVLMKSSAFIFADATIPEITVLANAIEESSFKAGSAINMLLAENNVFRETLKLLLSQVRPVDYDKELAELHSVVYHLNNMVHKQATEITKLRSLTHDLNEKVVEQETEIAGLKETLGRGESIFNDDEGEYNFGGFLSNLMFHGLNAGYGPHRDPLFCPDDDE